MAKPKKLIWHHNNRARAEREGWHILPDPHDKLVRIAVPDIYPIWRDTHREQRFSSSADARKWVEQQAEAGSLLHKMALAYIAHIVIIG